MDDDSGRKIRKKVAFLLLLKKDKKRVEDVEKFSKCGHDAP